MDFGFVQLKQIYTGFLTFTWSLFILTCHNLKLCSHNLVSQSQNLVDLAKEAAPVRLVADYCPMSIIPVYLQMSR